MNKTIRVIMNNTLKGEARRLLHSDEDLDIKMEKLNDIANLFKIIENYDELEPILKEFFDKKTKMEKWER